MIKFVCLLVSKAEVRNILSEIHKASLDFKSVEIKNIINMEIIINKCSDSKPKVSSSVLEIFEYKGVSFSFLQS